MRKQGRKVLAFGLVLAMTASIVPVSAAANPTLNVKAKTIAVGDSTTLKVKSKPAKATYTWTSSNKKVATVNAKGVVKGKTNGVTTVTCTVKTGNTTKELTAKIYVFKLKEATKTRNVTAGEKITLKVQNYKGAKYTWTSSDKSVATVNSKGVVTGLKAGTTTIRCKVNGPTKRYFAQYKVKVNTEKKVVTQAQLEKALKNAKITTLTIAPKSNIDLTIPTGTYKNVDLVVDAPNADITNNGVFKTIKIKNIKPNTWHENAKGNRIGVYAKNASIVVEKEGSVDAMSFMTKGADVKVTVEGTVKEMKVKKENSLGVTVNGTVEKVSVSAPSDIKLDGTTKDSIPVNVAKEAEGAKVDTAVKVNLETSAKIDVAFQKGSEGSAVKTTDDSVQVSVDNKSDAKVDVTTPSGTQEVGAGESGSITSGSNSGNSNNNNNNNNGSTSGGGSSSGGGNGSGDNTPATSDYTLTAQQTGVILVKQNQAVTLSAVLMKDTKPVTGASIKWTVTDDSVVFSTDAGEKQEVSVETKDDGTATVNVLGKKVTTDNVTVTATYTDAENKAVKAVFELQVTAVDNPEISSPSAIGITLSNGVEPAAVSQQAVNFVTANKIQSVSASAIAVSGTAIDVPTEQNGIITVDGGVVASGGAIFVAFKVESEGDKLKSEYNEGEFEVIIINEKSAVVLVNKNDATIKLNEKEYKIHVVNSEEVK